MYDRNGRLLPSDQMREHGVPGAWFDLLRPWLDAGDINGNGRLRMSHVPEAERWTKVLDAVPSLDSGIHHIVRMPFPHAAASWQCPGCGHSFSDRLEAAQHQLGEREVRLLAQVHGWTDLDGVTRPLAHAAAARRPHRWNW